MPVFHDITTFGVGCITHGRYLPSLVANLALVGLILVIIGLIFVYESMRIQRSFSDGGNDTQRTKVLKEIYVKFDPDDDGIGLLELRRIVEKIDPTTDDAVVEAMFESADTDGGGEITFDEFEHAVVGTVAGEGDSLTNGLAAVVLKAELMDTRSTAIGRFFLVIFLCCELLLGRLLIPLLLCNCETRLMLSGRNADPPLTNKIFEVSVSHHLDSIISNMRACSETGCARPQVFACREIGPGESILIVDHGIKCTAGGSFTTSYLGLSSFGHLLVCAWPLGVPIMLFLFMWRVRAKIHAGDEDTLKLYDFVIGGYTDKYWYWVRNKNCCHAT